MRAVNQAGCKVLDILTKGLDKIGDHRKIDNSTCFMAVSVGHIGDCDLGTLYSVAHCYKQSGTLMRNLEMVFVRGANGRYYPTYFRQDGSFPSKRDAIVLDDGIVTSIRIKIQRKQAVFAGTWLRNIKQRQKL